MDALALEVVSAQGMVNDYSGVLSERIGYVLREEASTVSNTKCIKLTGLTDSGEKRGIHFILGPSENGGNCV